MEYSWINDDFILFSAAEIGTEKTFSVKVSLGKDSIVATQVDDSISSGAPIAFKKDKDITNLYFIRNSFTKPHDIWSANFADGLVKDLNQITFLNKDAISKLNSFIEPELFFFKGGYGDPVQGWIFKPINFDPSKKYPLAFLIHGGPESKIYRCSNKRLGRSSISRFNDWNGLYRRNLSLDRNR